MTEQTKLDVSRPLYLAANSRPLEFVAMLPGGEGYIVRVADAGQKRRTMMIVDRYGALNGKPYATNQRTALMPIVGAAKPYYAPLDEGQEVWRFQFTRSSGKKAFVKCTVLGKSAAGIVPVSGKRPGKIVQAMRSHLFETIDDARTWFTTQQQLLAEP